MRRLEDKVALVTGGGAGIGRAVAETFAREGAKVVVVDRDGEAAKEVADWIVSRTARLPLIKSMSPTPAQVKTLMEEIGATHGRLDVLVNNAGVGERSDFRHLSDEAWDRVWAVNLDGTVRCAREAFSLLKASGKAWSSIFPRSWRPSTRARWRSIRRPRGRCRRCRGASRSSTRLMASA